MHFLYTALEIAYTAHFILTNVSWLSFLEVMHIFKRGWSFFSTGTCQDGKNIVSVPGYICSTFVRFVIKIHVCIYKYYFIIFMRKIYNVKCLWNTHTCEISVIEIDERENLQDVFIDTIQVWTRKILKEQNRVWILKKQKFILQNTDIYSSFGSDSENLAQCFNDIIRVLSFYLQREISFEILFQAAVYKDFPILLNGHHFYKYQINL